MIRKYIVNPSTINYNEISNIFNINLNYLRNCLDNINWNSLPQSNYCFKITDNKSVYNFYIEKVYVDICNNTIEIIFNCK